MDERMNADLIFGHDLRLFLVDGKGVNSFT